jgi:transcriptional regulator MraZ
VFSGRFDHSIDDKGRVSIPARFRDALQREGHDRLVITNFIQVGERCLALYPPAEWDQLVSRIKSKPSFDPNVQAFETFYVGGAHEVQVDRQGRILIPTRLRDFASLGRDVTFSARHDHFQLWDKERLDKVLRATEQQIADPRFFEKLNL